MKRIILNHPKVTTWYRRFSLANCSAGAPLGPDPGMIEPSLRSLLSPVLGARLNGLFQSGS